MVSGEEGRLLNCFLNFEPKYLFIVLPYSPTSSHLGVIGKNPAASQDSAVSLQRVAS